MADCQILRISLFKAIDPTPDVRNFPISRISVLKVIDVFSQGRDFSIHRIAADHPWETRGCRVDKAFHMVTPRGVLVPTGCRDFQITRLPWADVLKL